MKMIMSCISVEHAALEEEWAKAKQELDRSPVILGRRQKPAEAKDGLLCLLDEKGQVVRTINVWMPMGMVMSRGVILLTSPWSIHKVSADLSITDQNIISSPLFNAVHSISRTQHGSYLLTSTGLDLLLEIDRSGHILWDWWAVDHSFDLTPFNDRRTLDKTADYRGFFYGTPSHTTHINSAIEWSDGTILASLFHQGMIIAIDRETKNWKPILEGLDHPHALRMLDQERFTLADSGRGRALLIKISNGKGYIEEELYIHTSWLQDCFYEKKMNRWFLLDAEKSSIMLRGGRSGQHDLGQWEFNLDWRLYQLLLLP